jgi:hypothetical protein
MRVSPPKEENVKRLLIVVAAALAFPGTALAKEIQSLSICGTDGCHEVAGAVQPFRDVFEGDGANAPRAVLDAVPVSPYYKLGVLVRGDNPAQGRFSLVMWYVRPNLVRQAEGVADMLSAPFMQVSDTLAAQLEAAAKSVEAFPEPRVMRVYVNDKRVANPGTYIGLFAKLPSTDATTDDGKSFVNITLTPDRRNPWFVSGLSFLYLNDAQSLFLAKPVRVSDTLAERIARDAHLASPVRSSGWSRPAKLGLLVGWIPIVVALGVAYTRRRHRHDPT